MFSITWFSFFLCILFRFFFLIFVFVHIYLQYIMITFIVRSWYMYIIHLNSFLSLTSLAVCSFHLMVAFLFVKGLSLYFSLVSFRQFIRIYCKDHIWVNLKFIFFFCFSFWHNVLLYSPGWSWTSCVVQDDLKFMVVFLPQLPTWWDCRCVPPYLVWNLFDFYNSYSFLSIM